MKDEFGIYAVAPAASAWPALNTKNLDPTSPTPSPPSRALKHHSPPASNSGQTAFSKTGLTPQSQLPARALFLG